MLQNACISKSLKQKPSSTARAVSRHELDGDSCTDGDDGDYAEEGFGTDGIDTPSDDFYNINTTNFNRNPQVKPFIPRTPKGEPKPKVTSNKSRYNGQAYLPKHIYDMLSEEVKEELDQCNKEKKANYQLNSNRMAKVHEQSHGDEDP